MEEIDDQGEMFYRRRCHEPCMYKESAEEHELKQKGKAGKFQTSEVIEFDYEVGLVLLMCLDRKEPRLPNELVSIICEFAKYIAPQRVIVDVEKVYRWPCEMPIYNNRQYEFEDCCTEW